MIIDLRKSTLFTKEPSLRFAKEHNLPKEVWDEIWRRYSLLDYTMKEVCDYYELKSGRKTTTQSMQRWLWRTEIYCRANHLMRTKGAYLVLSSYFGEHEMDVVKELTKNLKGSVKQESSALI